MLYDDQAESISVSVAMPTFRKYSDNDDVIGYLFHYLMTLLKQSFFKIKKGDNV